MRRQRGRAAVEPITQYHHHNGFDAVNSYASFLFLPVRARFLQIGR